MSALLVVGAIVAWVLGLARVTWLETGATDWLLVGLILYAAAALVGPARELVDRRRPPA